MCNEQKIVCRSCREELFIEEFPHGSNECWGCVEAKEDERNVSFIKNFVRKLEHHIADN
jgi:hypothetical protein